MSRAGGPTDKSSVSGAYPTGQPKGKQKKQDELKHLADGVQHAATRVLFKQSH